MGKMAGGMELIEDLYSQHLIKVTYNTVCEVAWVSSVLRPRQYSIGYMGDGFYRSKDPTNSIKVPKEATKLNKNNTKNIIHTEIRN